MSLRKNEWVSRARAGFIARAYASEGVPFIEELIWKIGFPLTLFGLFVFIQKKILRNIDERSK